MNNSASKVKKAFGAKVWSVQAGRTALFVEVDAKNAIEAANKALKTDLFKGLKLENISSIEMIEGDFG